MILNFSNLISHKTLLFWESLPLINSSVSYSTYIYFKLASATKHKTLAWASRAFLEVCISRRPSASSLICVLTILCGQSGSRQPFWFSLLLRHPSTGLPALCPSSVTDSSHCRTVPCLRLYFALLMPSTVPGKHQSLDTPYAAVNECLIVSGRSKLMVDGGLGVSISHLARSLGEDEFLKIVMSSRVLQR